MLIAFNKPFRVLCQFTDTQDRATLADFIDLPGVYAAGRLDHDSEGLLLLTDDGRLQKRIADPEHGLVKRYLAEVEGDVAAQALANLASRVQLRDGPARALTACRIETPALWPRDPPVRFRRHIPTTWIALELDEGRNRQVRRMTAAVGHPTLRLVREAIGPWRLGDLQPGEWREEDAGLLPLGRARRRPR